MNLPDFSVLNPFRREMVLQKNDICIHLYSRFGKVKGGVAHRATEQQEQQAIAYPVSYQQYQQLLNVSSWLEVAAILRKE